jgi:membrane associated rhomboid family serine protease
MLPLSDENPTRLTPIVNFTIAVFLWQISSTSDHFASTLIHYGVIPRLITNGQKLYTLVTNIFLHGGWTHLAGNMLFLWIFGDNIEDNIVCRSSSKWVGRLVYLGFYLLCGIAASLTWMITALNSPYPAVGASGAIAGVLGAYFIFYPNRMVRTLFGFGLFIRVIRVKAYTMIGFWFVYQFFMALLPINSGVAFWAHVGGFAVGVLLAMIFRPRPRMIETYYGLEINK